MMHGKKDNTSEGNVPANIKEFIFDLHQAVGFSCRLDEVQPLYETKFREFSDSTYNNSAWPDANTISAEVDGDEVFLALYREMTFRHVTTKLKPTLNDHLTSWANYKKLFEILANISDDKICLTTQWIYDITQEFTYQFQGFCQLRDRTHHNQDYINTLKANTDAWNYPEVLRMLKRFIRNSKAKSSSPTSVSYLLGYFSTIELARLECLTGDFVSSLTTLSHLNLQDKTEIFQNLPICHFNVFYHNAVCQMMLKRFGEALETFNDLIVYVLRLFLPGSVQSLRPGVQPQLQRMLEKAMSLTSILLVINPTFKLEKIAREALENKFAEKLKKLQSGDRMIAIELFESSSPKFISPYIPDYSAGATNTNVSEVFTHIMNTFVNEIMNYFQFLKLRSILNLYSSIDLSKLSRFTDIPEATLICLLLAYKNRSVPPKEGSTTVTKGCLTPFKPLKDIHFYIEGNVLKIDSTFQKMDYSSSHERYFAMGIKKNYDMNRKINMIFNRLK